MEVSSSTLRRICVIGGGLAGVSACLEAVSRLPSVEIHLFEKEKGVAGNSAKASSGMSAAVSSTQIRENILDSLDAYLEDTLSSGSGLTRRNLAEVFIRSTADAVTFLEDHGIPMDRVCQCGGHSFPRTHRSSNEPGKRAVNVGWRIMSTLREKLANFSNIRVHSRSQVTQLLCDPSTRAVNGLSFVDSSDDSGTPQEGSISCDAVILATGGYGASKVLLEQYAPHVAQLATTNGEFAQGEGVLLAQRIGASLVDMDQVQVHPTAFVDPHDPSAVSRILAAEALRGEGGILLDGTGRRFVNELGRRDDVTQAIFKHGFPFRLHGTKLLSPLEAESVHIDSDREPTCAFLVLNEQAEELFGKEMMGFYRFKKLVFEFENGKQMANALGFEYDVLVDSLLAYNSYADEGVDSFGKKSFRVRYTPEDRFLVAFISPAIHYTMGGVAFDEEARVLDEQGIPIPGLFAAGEVTGGLHGGNRLAGNSLAECVVFGRIAGRNAVSAKL